MPTDVADPVTETAAKPKPKAKAAPKPPAKTMSSDHKEALALGRSEGRAVRAYLEALDSHRPKRGRRRTPESIGARLTAIDEVFDKADALGRLQMAQERISLATELAEMADGGADITELEAEFVRVAKGYATRKGISYAAFREIGVPAAALKAAGIARKD